MVKIVVSICIIVGTPGRVMHMIRKGALETKGVQILILDEVDVMLSRGFEQQVARV